MTIAICDDDMLVAAQLEMHVLTYFQDHGVHMEVEVFYTGESLCAFLQASASAVDLLFLDIELKTMTGIEIGQMIRTTLNNPHMQIVYISNHTSYALQLFEIRPFHFLVKPLSPQRLNLLLDNYLKLYNRQKTFFLYKSGKSHCQILSESILYFYSQGKKIYVVTESATPEPEKHISFYGKLTDVLTQVDEYSFWMIHKSYLINADRALVFHSDEVEMANHQILPISHSFHADINARILKRQIGGTFHDQY